MLYVKIIGTDGRIIDAEAHADPVYVCYQSVNGIIVRCSVVNAQGLVSKDQSQTYQLQGRPKLSGKHLVAEEISQADYDALIEELDIDDDDPPAPDPGGDDDPGADVMTVAEMREAITELRASNEFLEDCLLEISEVIYG